MTELERSVQETPAIRPREVLAAAAMALVFGVGHALLDRMPVHWDEYYHLLAARSWANDGTFVIASGSYERATWLSAATGWMFRILGEGVSQARLLPAMVHAATVVGIFLWVRGRLGPLPAWAGSAMYAAAPIALVNAVMVRFYGVATLLVLVSTVLLDWVTRGNDQLVKRMVALVVLAATVVISYRVTPLTRVWLFGPAIWAIVFLFLSTARSRYRCALTATIMAVGLLCLHLLWSSGEISIVIRDYRAAPLWSQDRANDLGWYLRVLRGDYPTLLTLFPLAVLLGMRRDPRLAGLCVVTFSLGFMVLSGAGPKSERYLLPILPFFFITCGLAFREIVPALRGWIDEWFSGGPADRINRPLKGVIHWVALVTVVGTVIATNSAFSSVRHWASGQLAPGGHVKIPHLWPPQNPPATGGGTGVG